MGGDNLTLLCTGLHLLILNGYLLLFKAAY